MPRTTRRTPTHGAVTLCCAPFQATCRRRVETPAAAPPSQTQQRIAHRKAVSVARKPPRGRPASCLFIRHYWGHRSYFLLLRRVICLSSAGSSACLRSIACKPSRSAPRRAPVRDREHRGAEAETGSGGGRWGMRRAAMARVRAAGAGGRRGGARPVGAGVGDANPLPQHTTGIRLGSAPARPAPSPHGPAPRGGPPKGPPDACLRPARAGRSPKEASQQRRPADPGHRRRMPHRAGHAQPLGIHAAPPGTRDSTEDAADRCAGDSRAEAPPRPPRGDWGGVPGWIGANAETRAAQGSGAPPAGRLRSEPFLCAVHETLRFTKLIGGSSVLHHNTDLGIHHSGLCACRRLTNRPSACPHVDPNPDWFPRSGCADPDRRADRHTSEITIMILLQVHLQQPCYDFCFL